ncbi:aspartate aminotransferase family protein [Erwinia tracheiphila]|uniref:Adenosylmethionine-8-amino-7-oxononanoate aminotransferase n=1 Tax=Erwinia tracheiphila TaxID=65700 RepID=A0A0M2KDW8_9GAMM|nr:aspartate aminotransferase family protein [Erwinia tracheiphila]EOS95992.1 class III aminotransferase [Erwinia tracheiphila PSU-1]KKF35413.1 adenosylmethionine-8-amino-7-oxononanoate aminotransferase [Erwinia tracheiphila]UIA87074.1 aspartate aminotransferase family protein [Erwinia tracheiphila]UIA95433.1 aspartate aminotransferase family protein [Erwinia tracheiphila]
MNPASSAYWPPYTVLTQQDRRPVIQRGEGVYLYDDHGRRYLDAISGCYNHCLGHSHPEFIAALQQQLSTLIHACNIYSNTQLPGEMAEKLVARLPDTALHKTFIVGSGSEGVESALKMAWQYQVNASRPQRTRIVAIEGAYHGCTLGAMMATRRSFINEGILPSVLASNTVTMPFPQHPDDIKAWEILLEEQQSTLAAVIIEPIMAMEGTRQFPDGFLQQLSRLTRQHDILLICDEVYCGIGRAGAFCESVSQGAHPDIVIFSKCLGGGVPVTAVLATEAIADSFSGQTLPFFRHGHTQSGNLLGCSAALFVLDYLDNHYLLDGVVTKGEQLLELAREQLPETEGLISLQGKGLMLSITFASPELCSRAQSAIRQQGVIVGAAGPYLKLAPAFTISSREIAELTERMATGLKNL